MKKSLIFTFFLAIAMLIFCIMHGVQIYDAKNNIEYTEEVLCGDVLAAEGLHFQIPNHFGYIAWLTHGEVNGTLKCETQYMSREELFQKLPKKHIPNQDYIKEIIIYRSDKDWFTNDVDGNITEAMEYEKMLKELSEDVAIGQTKEFEVKLSDYCQYYDLTAKADMYSDVYFASIMGEILASLVQVEVGDDVILKGKITGYENTLSMTGVTKAYIYDYELIGGIYPYVRAMCFENGGYFYLDYYDKEGNRLTGTQYQPKLFRADWTMTEKQAPKAIALDIDIHNYTLEEVEIDGNILEICKCDDLFVLVEENKELFFQRMNVTTGQTEKLKLCNIESEIENVYMEGSEQGIFLVVDTVDGLKIYFVEKDGEELRPYIYAGYEKNECLKQLDIPVSSNGKENDFYKIAYVYQDKKLAMLWRSDENNYNLLVLSEDAVQYASVLHANFEEGLEKENTRPIKIWFE